MQVEIPREVLEIVATFKKEGYEIYIVGGAVRDILKKKIVYDWDFTTNAEPEKIQELFPDSFYDNKFGTVGIPADKEGERPYEVTTFRTEHGYSDTRRPDKVKWGKTLEEDLKRRDFTINAMALEIQEAETKKSIEEDVETRVKLIDLFDGKKDLDKKLIRAVGEAKKRFSEDALRMMRAIRIASQLKFEIEDNTLKAIKENAKLIKKIARERIKDELIKILASPHPYHGIQLLRNVSLMEILLPELENTFGVEQASPGRHHIYDVGKHSMYSLKHVAKRNQDPIVRLATLIHDIGKPETFRKLPNGTITFYNHEMAGARIAKQIAKRFRFSKKQSEKLYKLVRWHQFTVDENQTDSAIRRFVRNVGKENVTDMLDLRVGDRLGGGARETSWRLEEFKKRLIEVQKQPFTVHDLKITGDEVMEIMGINPGPKVGKVLKKLYKDIVEKKISNDKKNLRQKIKKMANEKN